MSSSVALAPSAVFSIPAASPHEAHQFFSANLGFETDSSDVHHDLTQGQEDPFILIDARSAADHAQ